MRREGLLTTVDAVKPDRLGGGVIPERRSVHTNMPIPVAEDTLARLRIELGPRAAFLQRVLLLRGGDSHLITSLGADLGELRRRRRLEADVRSIGTTAESLHLKGDNAA